MIVNVDEVGVQKDEKYFRVFVRIETHTFHSEKLNEATKNRLLGLLLDVDVSDKKWPTGKFLAIILTWKQ